MGFRQKLIETLICSSFISNTSALREEDGFNMVSVASRELFCKKSAMDNLGCLALQIIHYASK